jgi:hypothetical protein
MWDFNGFEGRVVDPVIWAGGKVFKADLIFRVAAPSWVFEGAESLIFFLGWRSEFISSSRTNSHVPIEFLINTTSLTHRNVPIVANLLGNL